MSINKNYIPTVIDATYLDDFQVEVDFDNGDKKRVNMKPYLHGKIFELLKDEAEFKKFFCDGWTIAWSNGADIAPDTLFSDGVDID